MKRTDFCTDLINYLDPTHSYFFFLKGFEHHASNYISRVHSQRPRLSIEFSGAPAYFENYISNA